jgi:hypothetical protein
MPITQADLPVRILDSFVSADVRFLVLHNEEKVGTAGLTSDVDIVLDMPVRSLVRLLRKSLLDAGVVIALVWPYDVGGGASVFFTDREGKGGAQIDALYDVRGSGRYGLRSNRLFAGQVPGRRFPIPHRLDELLYVARKAAVKGKEQELTEVRRTIDRDFAYATVVRRVRELFSPSAATSLLAALEGDHRRKTLRPIRWARSLVRIGRRVIQPIGFWAHISGSDAEAKAEELQSLFGGWLVRTESGRRPRGLGAMPWWATVVMPVRLRPGLFLSHSEHRPNRPKADLQLSSRESAANLAASIVEAMARKATR